MDKFKPSDGQIENWKKKYKGPYIISDKLDGVSGLFMIKNGEKKLFTRGDGTYGTNISSFIPFFEELNQDFNSNFSIRGEFIISKENFKKIQR